MKLSRLLLVFTLMLAASIAHAEERESERQFVSGPRSDWQAVIDAVELTGHQTAAANMEAALSAMTEEELFLGFGQMDLTGLAEAFLDVAVSFDAVKERYPETSTFLETQKVKNTVKKGKTGNPVSMSAGLPGAVGYPGIICPISPERSNADDLLIAVAAINAGNIALEIANGVWSVADRACGTVVVAIGAAGNPQNAGCIITDTILFVAQAVVTTAEAVVDGIAFCDGAVDSAEIEGAYERAGHIHADLDAHDGNIDADLVAHNANIDADLVAHNANIDADLVAHNTNNNNNTNIIIANDNANKDTIVTNDDDNMSTILAAIAASQGAVIANTNAGKNELRDLILRTQIASALASEHHEGPVGLYVLPTADGGYLELVREIVLDIVTKLAGKNTDKANGHIVHGDDAKAAGDYKKAYEEYTKAYKDAMKK